MVLLYFPQQIDGIELTGRARREVLAETSRRVGSAKRALLALLLLAYVGGSLAVWVWAYSGPLRGIGIGGRLACFGLFLAGVMTANQAQTYLADRWHRRHARAVLRERGHDVCVECGNRGRGAPAFEGTCARCGACYRPGAWSLVAARRGRGGRGRRTNARA